MQIKKRNVALCILFTIITFGIYGLYWIVTMTNDTNALCPEHKTASGIMVLVFDLITFGIYSFYWTYKLGQKVGTFDAGKSKGGLYLLFAFLGFGFIVNPCLAQSAINRHATV